MTVVKKTRRILCSHLGKSQLTNAGNHDLYHKGDFRDFRAVRNILRNMQRGRSEWEGGAGGAGRGRNDLLDPSLSEDDSMQYDPPFCPQDEGRVVVVPPAGRGSGRGQWRGQWFTAMFL